MYNGIGLNTPRGTGTNGYVQSNAAHVKEWKVKRPDGYREILDIPAPKIKEANKDILSHEKKRKIEVEVYKYRLELEEKNISEEEIEVQVEKKREVLLRRSEVEEMDKVIKRPGQYSKEKREEKKQFFNKTNKESHSIKEAQLKKNERAKEILGIRKDFQPGDGFDFDGERKKQRETSKKEEEEKLDFIKQIEKSTNSHQKEKTDSPRRRRRRHGSSDESSSEEEEERKRYQRRREYSPERRDRRRRREYSPERRKRYYSSDSEEERK
eukprot:gene3912-7124_t